MEHHCEMLWYPERKKVLTTDRIVLLPRPLKIWAFVATPISEGAKSLIGGARLSAGEHRGEGA